MGLGAVGLKKAWDKFAPTKKAKLARAQKKIDKQKKKESDAETHADAKAVKFKKDEDGYIASAGDAEKYKKIAGKAPAGWETGDDGKVVKKGEKPKEEPKKKPEKESFEPEKDMTLQESNELQAIMALDDVGISAEINRKGQVVVKKKDLKKAEKALKKSFKKGGEPKLVGEGVLEDGTTEMANQYKNDTPGQVVTEALKPLDKSVIDAFYYKKEKAGKVVSTDGDSLYKGGMGGQKIAQWLDPAGKIYISAVTDVKSTESILKYMKKSIPKGNFDKKSYKQYFGEELQRTAYELVSGARKKAAANKPKWEQE